MPKLSPQQERYIKQLMTDCQIEAVGDAVTAWLSTTAERAVKSVQELTPQEANIVIDRLRAMRYYKLKQAKDEARKPDAE